MPLNFGLTTNSNKSTTTSSNDKVVAKNIIDILFAATEVVVKNDHEINAFTKSLTLSALPGVRNGSKNSVSKMNSLSIKKLLDDIQNQLNLR